MDFRVDEEEVIDLDLEKWSSDESNEDQQPDDEAQINSFVYN